MRALWVIDFKPGWPIYIYIQDEAALGSDQERSNPNRLCGHPALRLSCSHPGHPKIATFWCSPDAPCIEPSTHDDLFQMMSPMDESPSPSAQATPTSSHEGRGHSTGLSPPLATVGVCPPCGPSLLAKRRNQKNILTIRDIPKERIKSRVNSIRCKLQ